jgi:uncharacterized protein (TIGR03437 family)
VIEKVSGMPYEQYVQQSILSPLGIHISMRVGRTLSEGRSVLGDNDRDRSEALYSSPTSAPSVFPYITGSVRQPYGEWYQEGLEASGGWVANAPALVRLVDGTFGRQGTPALFSTETLAEIGARPSFVNQDATEWIGLGWQIIPLGQNAFRIRAAGLLRGSMAEVYYLANGNTYAFIGNSTRVTAEEDQSALTTLLSTRLGTLPAAEGDLYKLPRYLEIERRLPTIRAQKGAVHGASFQHGVVPGSWMSIFGWDLANSTRTWNEGDFNGNRLPVRLDGVEVFINDRRAAVHYVSPTQINIQVPDLGSFTGTGTLRTVLNGVSSYPEPIEIRSNAPEFFRYDLGGKSWVSAVFGDGVAVGDPSLAPGLRPARTGDILSIFGTGFTRAVAGQIIGPAEVVNVPNTSVRLGTTQASLQFSGLTGAGLFQVNVFIPALPPGDYPVSLSVDGVPSLQVGMLAVR